MLVTQLEGANRNIKNKNAVWVKRTLKTVQNIEYTTFLVLNALFLKRVYSKPMMGLYIDKIISSTINN